MSIFKTYASDATLEVEGVRKEFPSAGVSVVIARAGGRNTAFNRHMSELLAEHAEKLAANTMEEGEFDSILVPAYATHVVKLIEGPGWVDENDNPMGNTPEDYEKALRALPDFYEEIRNLAFLRSTFRKKQDDAIAGN